MTTIYIVQCVKTMSGRRGAAKDMYASPYFKKCRRHVEERGGLWFILSAKHHLLEPDTPISPYQKALDDMSLSELREWGREAVRQMKERLPTAERVVFLCGAKYECEVLDWLQSRYPEVEAPLQGKRIGERMQWLDRQHEELRDGE